jgi:hydroxyacylglutathione hydrolase
VGTLEQNLDKISKNRPVIIHCQGGDRASIAYSLLAKHGYQNVLNYSAGMNEWVNKGNPVVSAEA